MDASVIDFPALFIAATISIAIAAALIVADRGNNHRRAWIVAGGLAALLLMIGLVDLARESPRETHFVTAIIGAGLPVLGALGMVRATRRVRPWQRWLMVFATAFVLLFLGLLLGAAVLAKYLRS